MADPDPVDIVVRIKNRYSDQINQLKNELRSIQNSVDVGLDLDDNGDIDLAKMSLKQIDNLIEVLIRVDDSAVDAAALKLEAIKARSDPKAAIRDTNGDMGLGSGKTGWLQGLEGRISPGGDDGGLPGSLPRSVRGMGPGAFSGFGKARRGGGGGIMGRLRSIRRGYQRVSNSIQGSVEGMGGRLKKMMPTMRKWMNLIAALIPMLITLGVQALGVATAMASLGAASGAVVAGGLLGYGDTLSGSMDKAKKKLKEFAKETFQVFKPTFQSFNPITEKFLNNAPSAMQQVSDSLLGLKAFTGNGIFRGLMEWIAEGTDRMVAMERMLTQLGMRFGRLVGTGIIDMFEWLAREGYENQDAMLGLWDILVSIGEIIYNVSKYLSDVIRMFGGLFDVVSGLSKLLDSDFAVALGRVLALAGSLVATLYAVEKAAAAVRFALAKSGIGLALVAAGTIAASFMKQPGQGRNGMGTAPGGLSGGQGAGGDKYVFNYDGSGTYKDMNRFRRTAEGVVSSQKTDDEWRSR